MFINSLGLSDGISYILLKLYSQCVRQFIKKYLCIKKDLSDLYSIILHKSFYNEMFIKLNLFALLMEVGQVIISVCFHVWKR